MTDMKKFARSAAENYLQYIVFVDDEIYSRTASKPVENVVDLPALKSPFAQDQAPAIRSINSGGNTTVDNGRVPFHPKQLVESFARKGMNCALYEPQKGFDSSINSELFKLCDRADAIILDWDLYQEDGRNILPLVKNLVNVDHSSMPHHARLCVVYTTKPDLTKVASEIFEFLQNSGITVDDAKSPAYLTVGATHIVIMGKPDVTGRPECFKHLEVAEENLADRVIDEFVSMHTGLLSAHILYGVASVRRNSKRILDRFHSELDGPFLLQRALMLKEREELFEQLPELITDELLSIISDDQVDIDITKRIIMDRVKQFKLDSVDCVQKVESAQLEEGIQAKDYPALFLNGNQNVSTPKGLKPKHLDSFHKAFGCEQSKSDKNLASLFALRANYCSSATPKLKFGTIGSFVDTNSNTQYWVCLMPSCDCVRLSLDKPTIFPFWTLSLTPKSGSRGIVVPVKNDYLELYVCGKIKENMWIESFGPHPSRVVQAVQEGEHFVFNGKEQKLTWLAQLKPSHAQRIAHDIGQSFSRVGVMEAEWLHIKSKN